MPLTKHWNYKESEDIVRTSINGVCLANPYLKYIESERVVYNPNSSSSKVTVLSGGGSGHEPLHLGFVGDGLLDVAVCGSVFASPSVKQIVSGLHSKPSKKGALVVVKNYTGDVLHFGLAAERMKSKGYRVELLTVQDDVSVGRAKNGMVGRRGLAGTVLVHKIISGKSSLHDNKADLDEVLAVGEAVNKNLVTIGASLDHVVIPGTAAANVSDENEKDDEHVLKSDEVEIGMGIHNEPGVKRVSPIPTVDELVKSLLAYLLDPNDEDRYYVNFDSSDDVVLLVNNLGATSNLELYAIQSVVVAQLKSDYNIKPVRIYTGTFTTSLDGPGISITLLNVTKAGGDEILECLDLPTSALGWNSQAKSSNWDDSDSYIVKEAPEVSKISSKVTFDANTVTSVLTQGCKELLELEPKLTLYDTYAGDGDCGETLAAGANSILEAIKDKSLELKDAVKCLDELTDLIESAMGGTSGGLYSIFISATASELKQMELEKGAFAATEKDMAKAIKAGLFGLCKYTRARVGDRTLMDALIPFVETFSSTIDLKKAAEAAHDGAEKTRKLKAKFGRASYVSDEEFKAFDKEGGLPDPGAIGLAGLFNGFVSGFYEK